MIERQSSGRNTSQVSRGRARKPSTNRLSIKYVNELEEKFEDAEKKYKEVEEKYEEIEKKYEETERKYKDVISESERLKDENKRLQEKKKEMEDRIRELERELESRTPSSQSLSTPSSKQFPKSNRPPKGSRPRGAPKGHRGASLRVPREADDVVVHSPDCCPDCGGKLGKESEGWSQTVLDIQPTPIRVTRHEYKRRWCPHCRRKVSSHASDILPNRNYGPNLATMVAFLGILGIPLEKIQLIIETLCGHRVSVPELMDLSNLVGRAVEVEYRNLLDEVREASPVYGDETSFRIDGINNWCWDFVWDEGVVYVIHPSRGKTVPLKVLGEDFQGLLGRDGWAAYDAVGGKHQLCYIHVNRGLARVEVKRGVKDRGFLEPTPARFRKRGRPSNELKEFLRFAELLRTIMRDAVRFSEREPAPTAEERREMHGKLLERLDEFTAEDWTDADAVRICKHVVRHRDHFFTFIVHPEIRWENNTAERGVKKVAPIRNNSGGRRSREGANTLQALLSVFETWRRRGLDVYEEARSMLLRSVGRLSNDTVSA